jgi:3-isopropylmalate/(R)-2-methylmalate dehydratase small subunit
MPRVVLSLGNDISTDVIYPGRYMATVLPNETPQYAFADYTEFNKQLAKGEIPAGSVIVAGENFGCGSSREQAVSTLKGHELVIVAKNISRIFLQNAINLGLRVFIAPTVEAHEGDEVVVSGTAVHNTTTGREFAISCLPRSRQAILDAGGLIEYTRSRLLERQRRIDESIV